MPSITKENYLKALYLLADKQGKISLTQLGNTLAVSIPTVNSMVKKLKEAGLVVYKKYRPLQLTAKGKKTASLIIRKHRLTEMFLVEKMGFGWEEVHVIAEEVEHINSAKLFDRMDDMLGYPTVDPHGSPIPNKNGEVVLKEYQPLSQIPEGGKARLCALTRSSSQFLVFLNQKDLKLGTELSVHSVEPFDQSREVSYGKHAPITLSREVCERLLVEILD
jgi:DtxR family Mn-dependent transcriptional regulator